MSRKPGIAVALILAVICALVINVSANRKYATATRTVNVVQAAQFIPAGQVIDPGMIKTVAVPVQMAQGLITDTSNVVGKSVKVSALPGQCLMQDALDPEGRAPGSVEIFFSVSVSSSAGAIPGDYMDVYQKAGPNTPGGLLYKHAEVLATVDSNSRQIEPVGQSIGPVNTGSGAAIAVGIEVPESQAAAIVAPASQNEIYLIQSAV